MFKKKKMLLNTNFIWTLDIYLFKAKDMRKACIWSQFDGINLDKEIMIAGNIQFDDNIEKFKKIADIVDISGGLETYGLKDISKIEIFLNKFKS